MNKQMCRRTDNPCILQNIAALVLEREHQYATRMRAYGALEKVIKQFSSVFCWFLPYALNGLFFGLDSSNFEKERYFA